MWVCVCVWLIVFSLIIVAINYPDAKKWKWPNTKGPQWPKKQWWVWRKHLSQSTYVRQHIHHTTQRIKKKITTALNLCHDKHLMSTLSIFLLCLVTLLRSSRTLTAFSANIDFPSEDCRIKTSTPLQWPFTSQIPNTCWDHSCKESIESIELLFLAGAVCKSA